MVSRLLRVAVVPMVVAALLCSCTSAPAATPKRTVPAGWTTHTFDGVTISTPSTWKVFRQPPVCPGSARVGALLLGPVLAPVQGAGCPAPPGLRPSDVIAPNVVNITNFSGTSSLAGGYHSEVVNGLHVRALYYSSLAWWIPSVGVLVSGTGPMASRIMRTVRAAGPSAISRPTGPGGQVQSANHVLIPKGWRSYTYSGAVISVPESWTVEHNTNCPLTTASGALLLGFPKVLMNCPSYPISLGLVELYHPTQVDTPKSRHIEVNGVAVEVVRASPSYTVWSVPSLGIDITGVGSEAVRILHTVRRARSKDMIASADGVAAAIRIHNGDASAAMGLRASASASQGGKSRRLAYRHTRARDRQPRESV